jgi:hypothetical protein
MKKIKALIKTNPEPARGTNYVNPSQLGQYAAANQIAEGSLDTYLSSKGINPKFISTATKIAYSKSSAFLKWKRDHITEDITTGKSAGDPRSKEQDSPVRDRAAVLKKATQHYKIKPVTAHKVHKEGSQVVQLTPEGVTDKQDPTVKVWKNRHLLRQLLSYLKLSESSKPKETALEKYRKAAAEREKKHKEIEKNSGGMTAAIDRLQKQVNKEEISQAEVNKFHAKLDKLVHKSFGKRQNESLGDPQAATQSPADGANGGQELAEKKPMSKSARIVKELMKKKTIKEDMHDHEKEDKSVQTYGKKPKFEKADEKDSKGEKKPSAAAVLTGGTTLTGTKRDDIEIDPMMRNRPGQPDVTKKDDKKDDKKEDKKKDK